jgi:hypothetical protein
VVVYLCKKEDPELPGLVSLSQDSLALAIAIATVSQLQSLEQQQKRMMECGALDACARLCFNEDESGYDDGYDTFYTYGTGTLGTGTFYTKETRTFYGFDGAGNGCAGILARDVCKGSVFDDDEDKDDDDLTIIHYQGKNDKNEGEPTTCSEVENDSGMQFIRFVDDDKPCNKGSGDPNPPCSEIEVPVDKPGDGRSGDSTAPCSEIEVQIDVDAEKNGEKEKEIVLKHRLGTLDDNEKKSKAEDEIKTVRTSSTSSSVTPSSSDISNGNHSADNTKCKNKSSVSRFRIFPNFTTKKANKRLQ